MSKTEIAPVQDAEIIPPSWEHARTIYDQIKLHVRLGLLGQVMLGFELDRLKRALGFNHGGARSHDGNLNRTWEDWLNSELGVTKSTAHRWIDCALVAKKRIRKLGGEAALLNLLDQPPSETDDENRKLLEAAVEKVTDGQSQKEFLEEAKLVKAPASLTGGKTSTSGANPGKEDDLPAGQLAFAFFRPVASTLHRACNNPDYKVFLHALDVESTEDGAVTLSTLEMDLEMALRDVRAAKAAKRGGES